MADEYILRLIAQDEATTRLRALRQEIRALDAERDSFIKGYKKFEGISSFDRQRESIRGLVGQQRELLQIYERNAQAAQRAASVLFPSDQFKSAKESAAAFSALLDPLPPKIAAIGHGFSNAANGSRALNREMRHVVAAFDEIASGRRGQFVSTLGASLRDAGFGAKVLIPGIVGIAAVLGGTAIIKGAEKIGDMAEKLRAGASATGMSIEQFSALAGAFRMLGMESNSADTTLRHFAQSLQTAIAEPSSKAAMALHALGISQQELRTSGNDVGGMLQTVAGQWTKYSDDANKAAAGQELFGKGIERVAGLLNRGSQGIQELTQKASQLGVELSDQESRALANTSEKIHELSVAIEGGAIKAFVEWKPAIDGVISSLIVLSKAASEAITSLGKVLSLSDESEFRRRALELRGAIESAGLVSPTPKWETSGHEGRSFGGVSSKLKVSPFAGQATAMERVRESVADARNSAASKGGDAKSMREAETKAEIAAYKQALDTYDLSEKERTQIRADIARANTTLANQEAAGAGKAARQAYLDFASSERLKIQEAKGDTKAILAIYDEWLTAARDKYHENANVLAEVEREKVKAVQQSNQERVRLELEGAAAMETAYRDIERGFAAKVTKVKGISPQQSIGFQMQEVGRLTSEMQKPFQDAMSNPDANQAQRTQAYWKLWDIGSQQDAKMEELREKWRAAGDRSAEAFAKPFKQAFDRLGSDLESALSDLISGKGTMAQIGQKLLSGATSSLISGTTSLLGKVGTSFLPGSKPGEGFGDYLGRQLTELLLHSTLLTGILASTTETAASASANVAVDAANFVKPSILGTTFQYGGIVPSAAGGWMLPGFAGAQPAMLHSREMVLPEQISTGLQNMIAGGGGSSPDMHLHFHGPADAPSMERWGRNFLRMNSGSLARVIDSGSFKIR